MTKPTIKVPSLSFVEVDPEAFKAECVQKFFPTSAPKFSIFDLVFVNEAFGRELPAVVSAISARNGGWVYSVVRPRWADGVLEQVSKGEDEMRLAQPATAKKGGGE